jgi:hypothetical protein
VDSLRAFVSKNGVVPLWTGALPTYLRSAVWWGVSVPVYTEAKRALVCDYGLSDTTPVHIAAGITSGLTATIASHPADLVKTRMQNQSRQRPLYAGPLDCLVTVARTDGVLTLWRGLL